MFDVNRALKNYEKKFLILNLKLNALMKFKKPLLKFIENKSCDLVQEFKFLNDFKDNFLCKEAYLAVLSRRDLSA